jgi:hypothetical protein
MNNLDRGIRTWFFSNMTEILFGKLAKGKLAYVYMPPKLLICQIIQNQTTTVPNGGGGGGIK